MAEIAHRADGPDGRVLVVVAPGVLNHENAEMLRACVERWLPNRDGAATVIDMGGVTLISTIGIAALLQVEDLCRRRGAGFVLAALPERQRSLLKMLHLTEKFRTAATVDEALGMV